MKNLLLAFIACSTLTSAFAQEAVNLDRDRIFINSHEASLVRTNQTPKKIKIEMMVPMSEPVCESYGTRMVPRTSSFHCGYVVERRLIQDRECVQYDANGRCATYRRTERMVSREIPNTCPVAESYCAQYGTATEYEKDDVTIEFKKASVLAEGEQEIFSILAEQKRYGSSSVNYKIEAVDTKKEYKIKQGGIFRRGTYTIEGK